MPRTRPKRLAAALAAALRHVEQAWEVKFAQHELDEPSQAAVHVFLHELLHLLLEKKVPWVCDPTSPHLDLANEVVVRILEDELGAVLGLAVHAPEEHVHDAALVQSGLPLTPQKYEEWARAWRTTYGPQKDLDNFCHLVADELLSLAR